ncbi:STAS domain-containing protein [Kitasatospora sp. DSM 101779]|nr:STAS domain-containing protein [Kitasatospora sp. DSM 101779]
MTGRWAGRSLGDSQSASAPASPSRRTGHDPAPAHHPHRGRRARHRLPAPARRGRPGRRSADLRLAFDHALRSLPAPHVLLVDCRELTFCTSAGLNAMLRARRLALRQGTALRLTGVTGQLRRLLRVTEVDTVLDIQDSPTTTRDAV